LVVVNGLLVIIFYALGSEEIFSGLKDIFRCRRRSVVPHHRRCKGKILSLRFTNCGSRIFPHFHLKPSPSPLPVTNVIGQECH